MPAAWSWGLASQAYGWYHAGAFYALSSVPVVLDIPILALVMQLLLLHIHLLRHKLTTYEYITMRVSEEVRLGVAT